MRQNATPNARLNTSGSVVSSQLAVTLCAPVCHAETETTPADATALLRLSPAEAVRFDRRVCLFSFVAWFAFSFFLLPVTHSVANRRSDWQAESCKRYEEGTI